VCAALGLGLAACTFGPTDDDAGTGGGSTTTTTLGDQCDTVDSAYCQQGPRCSIAVDLASCIANLRPLCCSGATCTMISTISSSTVDSCVQQMEALDCNTIANSQTPPSACLMGTSS
jgi:hypothetical protein